MITFTLQYNNNCQITNFLLRLLISTNFHDLNYGGLLVFVQGKRKNSEAEDREDAPVHTESCRCTTLTETYSSKWPSIIINIFTRVQRALSFKTPHPSERVQNKCFFLGIIKHSQQSL